jgi:hypothetical protein
MSFPLLVDMRANPSAGYLTGSTSSIDVIGAAQNGTITPNGANGSTALFSATVSSLSGRSNGNPVIYTDTNLFFSSEL